MHRLEKIYKALKLMYYLIMYYFETYVLLTMYYKALKPMYYLTITYALKPMYYLIITYAQNYFHH